MILDARAHAPHWLKGALKATICILTPVLLFGSPGTPDVAVFLDWQAVVGDQGLREAYRTLIDEYPPLTHVALGFASAAGRALDLSPFHALKLMLLMAGYASTLVIQVWRPRLVLPITALWALYAMVYGYLDVLFAAPLLITLWSLERGRAGCAGVAYALACSIKWQPVIIGPFILVHFWLRRDWRGLSAFIAAGAAVLGAILAVFGPSMIVSFARAVRDPFISGNALNVPWLITAALEHLGLWGFGLAEDGAVTNKTLSFADAPFPAVMVVLALKGAFVLAYGYAIACFMASEAKTLRDLLLYGLAGFLGFFVLNTGVHENHLFVPALLAVVLLDFSERPKWLIEALLAVATINLVLFFGLTGDKPPPSGPVTVAAEILTASLLIVVYVRLLALMKSPVRIWSATAPMALSDELSGVRRGRGRRR